MSLLLGFTEGDDEIQNLFFTRLYFSHLENKTKKCRLNSIILPTKIKEYVVCSVVSGIEGNPMSFGFVEGRGVGGEEGLEDFTFRIVLLETHGLAFA